MRLISSVLFLTVLSCGAYSAQPDTAKSVSTHDYVVLPKPEQLPSLRVQAMAGSPVAALQLALWYMKFPQGIYNKEYWNHIAAENGSMVGQYNFGLLLLSDKSDPLNKVRARYWLTKAASQGSELAKAQIALLNKQ